MSKASYKSSRKYKCPYCEKRDTRDKLVDHVNRAHSECIPEGYTAARAIYDYVNGKNYNTCMICKEHVYKWNEKINRYRNLCDKPECRAKVREIALQRHMKVYNKPTLLNDPEHQEKMLANRKISGKYKFSDGGVVTYTGKYEKNALEFMDTVLNIPSTDIQCPGPTFTYDYKGEKHTWITDIYYIPANLVIEIKDGGDNPNNRSMPDYRAKQVAKEKMITDLGTFNYIRLTNNDFAQLLDIFADMKNEALENPNPGVKIHINEASKIPDEIPQEIKDFLHTLNSYDYGFIKNGKKIKSMSNFFEDYKSLTISEFEKYEIGVCWDYVHYEADWFKKHGYKYNTFYIQVQDEDGDCPSHTYLAFYLPNSNKPYYFESSWGKYQGIESFDNITTLHNTIRDRHIKSAESKCDPKTFFREEYDAVSKSWEGLSCGEYMKRVSKGRIVYNESQRILLQGKYLINEEVGGLPMNKPSQACIVPYGMNNVFIGLGFEDINSDRIAYVDDDHFVRIMDKKQFEKKYEVGPILLYQPKVNIANRLRIVDQAISEETQVDSNLFIAETIMDIQSASLEKILLSEDLKYYDEDRESVVRDLFINYFKESSCEADSINQINSYGPITIHITPKGYCAVCNQSGIFPMRSRYSESVDSLKDDLKVMKETFDAMVIEREEIEDDDY